MKNYTLIPFSEEKAEAVRVRFENTLYRDVEVFINMYNSGVLNRQFADTKELLELVEDSYSNVSVGGNAVAVKTETEIAADKLYKVFGSWKALSVLRRELTSSIDLGRFSMDSVLHIDKKGFIRVVDTEEKKLVSTGLYRQRVESVKEILHYSSINNTESEEHSYDSDEDNDFLLDLSAEDSDGGANEIEKEDSHKEDSDFEDFAEVKSRTFLPSDILNIDDSFISDVYTLVPGYILTAID